MGLSKSQKQQPAEDQPVERIRLPFRVPYYAQVASPDFAEAVFDRGADPRGDPRWQEWDARDPDEYAYWCPRACGPVCVKMCAEAFGGEVKPVMGWVRQGLAQDGYKVKTGADGKPEEIGWKHAALAELIAMEPYVARSLRIANCDVAMLLSLGGLIIASVSYEIGTDRPVTRRGGHLVVVTGADIDQKSGQILNIYANNPSGRTVALRENACIPAERFFRGFSGRGILVSGQRIYINPIGPVYD